MSFCGRPIGPCIPMPPAKPPKQSRGKQTEEMGMKNERIAKKMMKLAKDMVPVDQQGNQSGEVNAITDKEVASILNDANELAECERKHNLAYLWDDWKHAGIENGGGYAGMAVKQGDTIGRMQEGGQNPASKTMHDRIATRFDTLGNRFHKVFCDSSSSPSTRETVAVPPPAPEPQMDFDDEMLDFAAKDGKKYVLYKQEANGMWRIRACKDFGDVKRGDFGGLVQSEDNLSQYGECWIYDGAQVKGRKVFGTEKVVPEGGAE